eukprot:COSAG01_NODE_962_length_12418_cov_57.124492_8_plen_159_part_00
MALGSARAHLHALPSGFRVLSADAPCFRVHQLLSAMHAAESRTITAVQIDLTHRDQLAEILTQNQTMQAGSAPIRFGCVRPPAAAHGKAAKGPHSPSCSPASVLSTSGRCTFRGWAHCAICAAAIVVSACDTRIRVSQAAAINSLRMADALLTLGSPA